MGFKDIGEIASRALQKTLEDPEQQKNLISSIAGFVSLPDRSDTSDSAFDLGRFRQFNAEREQEKANRALQAKLTREKEAADLKFRRDTKLKLADIKGKAVLAELRENRADERARLDRESKKEKGPDLNTRGYNYNIRVMEAKNASFNTDFDLYKDLETGVTGYIPTPNYFRHLTNSGHGFATFKDRRSLATDPGFQKFAKSVKNNYNEKALEEERKREKASQNNNKKESIALMGGPLAKFLIQSENVSSDAFATSAEIAHAKTPTQFVKQNNGLYLSSMSKGLTSFFKKDPLDQNNQLALDSLGLSKKKFTEIQNLYTNVLREAGTKGYTANNESLSQLGEQLSSIIDKQGEGGFFDAALRENLREKVITKPDGNSVIPSPSGSNSTITETDVGFILKDPIMRAIATHRLPDLVENLNISTDAEQVKTTSTNSVTGKTTIAYHQYSNMGEVVDGLADIESSAKIAGAGGVLRDAVNRVRSTEFNSNIMSQEVNSIHQEFVTKGVSNINRYDILTYLMAQRVKASGTTRKGTKIKHEYYAFQGIPKQIDGKINKIFEERSQKDRSLGDLLRHVERILNLSSLDPARFGGGTEFERNVRFAGTASDLQQLFNMFSGAAKEVLSQFGIRNFNQVGEQYNLQKAFYDGTIGTGLDEKDVRRMAGLASLVENAQKDLTLKYNSIKNKTAQDYNNFIKKSVILWEKTALTYKLAGIVQGDSTGGRTISDQDFTTIYNSLWGGKFAPEAVTGAALTNLFETTRQAVERREAERILMLTTGREFDEGALRQITDNIYQQNMKRFYDNRPGLFDRLRDANAAAQFAQNNIDLKNFRASYDTLDVKNKVLMSDADISDVLTISQALSLRDSETDKLVMPSDENIISILRPIIDETARETPQSDRIEKFSLFINKLNNSVDQLNLGKTGELLYKRGIIDTFGNLQENISLYQRQFMLYKEKVKEAKARGDSDEQIINIQNSYPVSVFDQFRIIAKPI